MTGARRMLMALVAAACVLVSTDAWAQSCTVNANTVAFGTYDPLALGPLDTASRLRVTCTSGPFTLVIYRVDLNMGQAGSFNPRAMTNGFSQLNYNLYTNSGRTTIWGDGSGGTSSVVGGFFFFGGGTRSRNHRMYGRSFAGQTVSVGSYLDTITATVTF